MDLTRRDLIKVGLFTTSALAVPKFAAAYSNYTRGDGALAAPAPFRQALTQPPVLAPVRSDAYADYYEIASRRTTAEILPGVRTPVSGYNDSYLGPTLRVRSGRTAVVTHTNGLAVPISVHTHGAYVDGDSDGHPSDPIAPGAAKHYVLPNKQVARTQWYHDHVEHLTATNVYAGLSGFYLIGDPFDDALPLPAGEFDVPLCIQDRLFNSDGTLHYPENAVSDDGLAGNVIVVNGKAQPFFQVSARRYRFRILNGSNARPYSLALSNGRPFQLVATEGGLITAPISLTSLPIWPGERYEIVIDFAQMPNGDSVVLNNSMGSGSTAQIMRFDVVRRAVDDSSVPAVLRSAADQSDDTHLGTTAAGATVTRRWNFGKTWDNVYVINGKTYDANRIDASPRAGDTEIWEFQTGYGWSHPVHVHLTNFKVLDRNGKPPPVHERELWKETVALHPGEKVRVLMKWPSVPVRPTVSVPAASTAFKDRYVFHCHNLGHEDHDMMAQFRVT